MDGKHKVQILDYKVINFTNKRTNAPDSMRLAQCAITSEREVETNGVKTREEHTIIGELLMPKHLVDTPKGTYLAEFELSVGQDLRVGSRLTALHPFGMSANKPVQKGDKGASA